MLLDVPSSYAADRSSDSDSDSVADSELELDLQFADEHGKRHSRKFGLGKLHISQLLEMVLQDAQTRLFFKAQSVIQSDIRYYVPKPADLAYPAKLLGAYHRLKVMCSLARLSECLYRREESYGYWVGNQGEGEHWADIPADTVVG